MEHKETDRENKIPITPMEGDQTEGGFLVELDAKDDEDRYFYSRYFNKKIKYKDPEEPTDVQASYILDCLNRTETAMTQAHALKAAELCLLAQEKAIRIGE